MSATGCLKPTSAITSIYYILPKVVESCTGCTYGYSCGCIHESFHWFPSGSMDFLRLELPKTFLSTSSPTSSASLTNKSGLGDENVGNESLLMAMPSNRSRVKLLRHGFFCWRFLDHTETWFGALWAYASRRWCELQLYPIKLHPFKLMFWNIFSCERTENVTAGRWKQLIKGQRPKIHIDRDTDAFLFRLFISEPAGREEAPVQSATCIQFNTSISVHFQWRLNGFTVSFTACECSFMLFADLRSLCWSYGCAVAHSAATAPPTKMRLGYMLHPWDVPHHQWCHFPQIHPRYNIIIHHL